MRAWGGLIKSVLLVWLILSGNTSQAKNVGTYGTMYDIAEQDALEWIGKKLNYLQENGEITKQQARLKERARDRILRPKSISIKKTTVARSFAHSLVTIVPEDILDAQGKVMYAKGTKINPLNNAHTQKALLFLDGDDSEQVSWALKEHQQRGDLLKLVLVNGSAIELMEQTEVRFYFDQAGTLTRHFHIEQIPAIVEQKGNQLWVSEIKL